ncbi:unnamed protein product [Choristocarpus tenellus]
MRSRDISPVLCTPERCRLTLPCRCQMSSSESESIFDRYAYKSASVAGKNNKGGGTTGRKRRAMKVEASDSGEDVTSPEIKRAGGNSAGGREGAGDDTSEGVSSSDEEAWFKKKKPSVKLVNQSGEGRGIKPRATGEYWLRM